ncbi:MAG: MFS transporter [Promethearchaeota archaeon]
MFKSKRVGSKTYYNVNFVSYVFIYLVYSSIFVFLNNYFPILFFDILDINRLILALMQFLAYSILLLRPIFAVITDKYRIKGYQRKYYIISSGYALALTYIFLGLSISNILIFGVMLILIYISSTMLDVSTKSLVIDDSPNNEIKKKYLFFIFVGEALGKFFPFFLFFLLINDIYSINSWETLIICSFILLIPLLSILPFIIENNQKKPQVIENAEKFDISNEIDSQFSPSSKITFILLCIFVFFAFSDVIFIYPFFSFILNKFGLDNFNLFNFFLTFYFLISITSSAIGSFIIKRIKPKKIIFILIPVIGIIYLLYTIVPFTFFTILYFIGCSLGTITNLNISVYIMKFQKRNKSTNFHLIASFRHLSTFIFLPLGTFLSNFIATEYLIVIGAFLLNFSLLSLIFVKL